MLEKKKLRELYKMMKLDSKQYPYDEKRLEQTIEFLEPNDRVNIESYMNSRTL